MPQKPPKPPHDDLSELEKRFEATTEALRRMTAETERSEELRRIDHEGILDPTINELRQNMRSLTLQVERQADATRAAQAENRGTAGAQELLRAEPSGRRVALLGAAGHEPPVCGRRRHAGGLSPRDRQGVSAPRRAP